MRLKQDLRSKIHLFGFEFNQRAEEGAPIVPPANMEEESLWPILQSDTRGRCRCFWLVEPLCRPFLFAVGFRLKQPHGFQNKMKPAAFWYIRRNHSNSDESVDEVAAPGALDSLGPRSLCPV